MFMQESTDARKTPPPRWCLHGQGDPMASVTEQSSHVITREAHLPGNFSGTEEMYIPGRMLHGTIPQALLDSHLFWQDDNDNLRGYPNNEQEQHIMLIEMKKQRIDGWGQEDAVCTISKRFLVKDNFKKEANDANLFESKHSEEETSLYDDNGARTRPELSSREIFYSTRKKMSVGFEAGKRATVILEEISEVIEKGYAEKAFQKSPHVILLNEEYYHQHVKPLMGEWAVLWLEIQHFKGVSTEDQLDYILKGPFRCGDVADRVEENCIEDHKKMLNLVHDGSSLSCLT